MKRKLVLLVTWALGAMLFQATDGIGATVLVAVRQLFVGNVRCRLAG